MTAMKVVIVSGLSGAGKGSILRVFEDLGFDAVDNPPMPIVPALVSRTVRPLAIGLDARSQGFDAEALLQIIADLRTDAGPTPELIYARADEAIIQRRFTETRRRHPLAPQGRVSDGIKLEARLTRPLLERAEWVLDTSGMSLAALRQTIEQRFRDGIEQDGTRRIMTVAVVSFAFPAGLPREADMVFDARFLRNPHYIDDLRDKTGLDADVAAYVEADVDFPVFFRSIAELCGLVIPRFVTEGKKYATVAIGCTGGRHRSVHIANRLGASLDPALTHAGAPGDWSVVVYHRDLSQPSPGPIAMDNTDPAIKPTARAADESRSV